jgi:CMP-N,N'-diacetyllegionaminic acid synthase
MVTDNKSVAIIPARGGSVGIPHKNITPLDGRPLIAYTIEAALASQVDRTIVSTDDEEIAEVSRRCGADVPFMRPRELALGDSPTIPVLVHAVRWLESAGGPCYEYIVLLQPTSPFRSREDIDGALDLIGEKDADSVIGVSECAAHPYLAKRVSGEGILSDFTAVPEGYLRRQALPETVVPNGAVYVVRRDVLLERETLYTDRTYAFRMPQERSLDIDTPWDFYVAALIARDMRLKKGRVGEVNER